MEANKTPKSSVTAPLHGIKTIIPTKMFEVVFYPTPWVFRNKGLHKTPGLLLVYHVSVNPAHRGLRSRVASSDSITYRTWVNAKEVRLRDINILLTWVCTCVWSYWWCRSDSACKSNHDMEHRECRPQHPPCSIDLPLILYIVSTTQRQQNICRIQSLSEPQII